MKRQLILLGLLASPLALLVPAREVASWRPRLVATDPDGICSFQWSDDGKTVKINAVDQRQTTHWDPAYLDVASRQKMSDQKGKQAFIKSGLTLENTFWPDADDKEAVRFKGNVLSVCDAKQQCRPLQGTDFKRSGWVMHSDPTLYTTNYDCSQFSPDFHKVSIASHGAIYTWATRSGHLLSRVPLDEPKASATDLSRDGKLIVAECEKSSKIGGQSVVFNAQTGKRLYGLPPDGKARMFSSSGKEIESASYPDHSDSLQNRYSFFDARDGHFLWRCPSGETPFLLTPAKDLVFTNADKALRLRDIRTGNIIRTIIGPASSVQTMALSLDGSQLWTSHANGQIWSWRAR